MALGGRDESLEYHVELASLLTDRQVAWFPMYACVGYAVGNKASFVWGSVSVIYCIIRNHQKLSGSKQQPFYLLMILRVSNLGGALLVLPGVPHTAILSCCL